MKYNIFTTNNLSWFHNRLFYIEIGNENHNSILENLLADNNWINNVPKLNNSYDNNEDKILLNSNV